MSLRDNKKLLGGGAALAGLAGLGLFVKNMMSVSDAKNASKVKRTSPSLPANFMGAKIEMPEYYEKLLSDLPEPKLLYKHFMTCLSTPRPSGKLDKMRAALKATADALKVEYTEDKIGNVCLKKKGSPGFEDATGVVIQCHMDMVCTKTDDCKLNFDTDPIEAYLDGDWLKAKQTTLGADDGIGVAAGLALMEHPDLKHGPIEILITVDEETSMGGAIELAKAPFLSQKVLINVDSEEDHRICIGCAGGFGKEITIEMDRVPLSAQYKVHRLNVSGLCGGHSGIEIHLGRANAVQLLCRILNFVDSEKDIPVQLIEMSEGRNAMNSIPPHADCVVAVPTAKSGAFEEAVHQYWLNFILPEFKDIESKMHFDHQELSKEEIGTKSTICTLESTQLLVAVMMGLPHGVIRNSPTVEGLVQTSIAFTQMTLVRDGKEATCGLFARSMSMNEMLDLNRKLDCMVKLFGDKKVRISEMLDLFPGWDPVTTSPALEHCKNAHVALFGEDAAVYAVHAGLECGLIKDKYPTMDCVSIGPLIKGAHSTDERLDITTVPGFYDWLVETVSRIAVKPVNHLN